MIRSACFSVNGSGIGSITTSRVSGLVSFSPQLHSVFGRSYRVMEIQNNVPRVVTTIVAKVVPKI